MELFLSILGWTFWSLVSLYGAGFLTYYVVVVSLSAPTVGITKALKGAFLPASIWFVLLYWRLKGD
jgi:uncharacterized MnhB-related membrane protein